LFERSHGKKTEATQDTWHKPSGCIGYRVPEALNLEIPLPLRHLKPALLDELSLSRCALLSQGPRACEYSGLLYCLDCHRNDAAVTPAAVLHAWDFSPRPVCCLAADFLASIHDQPLLCVGAVNPGAPGGNGRPPDTPLLECGALSIQGTT
jgi:Putative zinc-RING and/or ribbon